MSPNEERILYLSYDGVLEPLGESQVVAYLERLAPGREIHLISFEKERDFADESHVIALRTRLATAGIAWHPRRWRNRPRIVSAVWNLAAGAASAIGIALRYRIAIFHARNIFCSGMGMPALFVRRGKLISDIRGFWPDERADAGLVRPGGLIHKTLKVIERTVLRRSAAIVTLTEASVPILRSDPNFGHPTAPIYVIPTCVDLARFQPAKPPANDAAFVLGYVGSFGTWYMLDETVALFAALLARKPGAKFLIANRNEHRTIDDALARYGIPPEVVELRSARFAEVPALIGRMNAGVCFVRPQFSKISSAPTKFAEYLACGVPVVATLGVGDMAEIMRAGRVGLVADRFGPADLDALVDGLMALRQDRGIRERCRSVAEAQFSLEAGVSRYSAIYDSLGERPER